MRTKDYTEFSLVSNLKHLYFLLDCSYNQASHFPQLPDIPIILKLVCIKLQLYKQIEWVFWVA
jgi:hypothetical protein